MTIRHGIPKHPYFCIVQPGNQELRSQLVNIHLQTDWKNPVIDLHDPVSNEIAQAEVIDIWKFDIEQMPQMFTLLTYGKEVAELQALLRKRYPQLTKPNSEVEYWLLKRL